MTTDTICEPFAAESIRMTARPDCSILKNGALRWPRLALNCLPDLNAGCHDLV